MTFVICFLAISPRCALIVLWRASFCIVLAVVIILIFVGRFRKVKADWVFLKVLVLTAEAIFSANSDFFAGTGNSYSIAAIDVNFCLEALVDWWVSASKEISLFSWSSFSDELSARANFLPGLKNELMLCLVLWTSMACLTSLILSISTEFCSSTLKFQSAAGVSN